MDQEIVRERLIKATNEHRLLDHPFYQAWVEGTLTRDDLAHYSEQYYKHVRAFPSYLETLAARLPIGAAQQIVRHNLADEVDGDHASLWRAFAEAVDATEPIEGAATSPETTDCIAAFRAGTGEGSLPYALGMLFGYESQTPEVARTKADGLRSRYGIDGPGVEYFELHAEMDVEHSAELADAIATLTRNEEEMAEAEAGAKAGAAAVWKLLDGVESNRAIAA